MKFGLPMFTLLAAYVGILTGCSSPLGVPKSSAGSSHQATVLNLERQRPAGLTGDAYRRIADYIDHPEAIFAEANYQPLWTATAEEAKGRLPINCTVVPHEARVWEPWFRQTLKNGDKVLSTADLLMVRDAVCLAVASDPNTQFRPPEKMMDIARDVDSVRKKTLAGCGVDAPSSTP
jgi:hypothetical protein